MKFLKRTVLLLKNCAAFLLFINMPKIVIRDGRQKIISKFCGMKILVLICTPETVDVAQLVRVPDCGSEGRGFESHLPPEKRRGCPLWQPHFFYHALRPSGFCASHRLYLMYAATATTASAVTAI